MGFYLHKTPRVLACLFPRLLWRLPNPCHKIYLTFDDGPTPRVTDFVLRLLADRQVKATFFCLGGHVHQSPDLVSQLVAQGHSVGNHGYAHADGWKISRAAYQSNVLSGYQALAKANIPDCVGFRPPYGHFRATRLPPAYPAKTILWSLLAGDFDPKCSAQTCLKALMRHTRSGDIIVFHDQARAFKTLEFVLPRYLDFCLARGFLFHTLKGL